MDLDPAVPLLLTRYSKTGRPGIDPIKLFRSHLFESRHKLNHKEFRKILHRSSMVRALCGFESIDEIPISIQYSLEPKYAYYKILYLIFGFSSIFLSIIVLRRIDLSIKHEKRD